MNNLEGKVCLVTGATSGIGKVTALELARQGATVVITARSQARGEAVQRELQQLGGNAAIDLLIADFSSLQAVRELVVQFKARYDHLHVLVNNAGAFFMSRKAGPDGFEMTFTVNYLAPFLLTNLLLDTLKASAPARIVNVSSDAHYVRPADPPDWQLEGRYASMMAYGQSKLALVAFTYALARRLVGTGVTANVLHPGVVATNIWGSFLPPFLRWLTVVGRLFGLSQEEGARTTLYLATSPEVAEVSGKYFDKSQEKRASRYAYDEALQEQLWQLSEQWTGLVSSNQPV
jgi:NAD(P)-dependent dehydrogenase (short-subunit alcohol dehydrogenase family)